MKLDRSLMKIARRCRVRCRTGGFPPYHRSPAQRRELRARLATWAQE